MASRRTAAAVGLRIIHAEATQHDDLDVLPLRSDLPAAAVTSRICSGEVELRTAFRAIGNRG